MTTQEIDQAFAELEAAIRAHNAALITKMCLQNQFDTMYQVGVFSYIYAGKNELERMGSFRTENGELMTALEEAMILETETKMQLTIAKNKVKRLELLLRSMEEDETISDA